MHWGFSISECPVFFWVAMTSNKESKGGFKRGLEKADEELKEELMQRLVDSKLLGAALQVSFNHDPARLPLRELPHGSWSELFLMYKSYAGVKNEPHACRATFFKWHKNGNRAFDSTRRHNMLSVQLVHISDHYFRTQQNPSCK